MVTPRANSNPIVTSHDNALVLKIKWDKPIYGSGPRLKVRKIERYEFVSLGSQLFAPKFQ